MRVQQYGTPGLSYMQIKYYSTFLIILYKLSNINLCFSVCKLINYAGIIHVNIHRYCIDCILLCVRSRTPLPVNGCIIKLLYGAWSLWARHNFHAIAVTHGLGLHGLIRRTVPFSSRVQQAGVRKTYSNPSTHEIINRLHMTMSSQLFCVFT